MSVKITRKNLKHFTPEEKAERHRLQQKECCKRYYLKNKQKLDDKNKTYYLEHRDERLQKQIIYQKKRTAETRIQKLKKQLDELTTLTNAF